MRANSALLSITAVVATFWWLPVQAADDPSGGSALYAANCLECHMAGGGGVPFMQPPLKGSARVLGEADVLIDFVLWGTAGREGWVSDYQNAMPAFSHLTDIELEALLSYIRTSFGNDAPPVGEAVIATVRDGKKPQERE